MDNNYHNNKTQDLVAPKTRKRIFKTVLITHIVLIGSLLLWGVIAEFFKPKREKVITVSLASLPAESAAPSPVAYSPPKPEKKATPKTKKTIKKRPKKTRKKVKKKPKWKPAKKIKISKEVVYVKPKKTWKPVSKPKTFDRNKLINKLNQSKQFTRVGNNVGVQSYENSVGAYLHRYWETPAKSVLGNRRPEVTIKLKIASNGKLMNYSIVKASGITAVDNSVKNLLKKVKYLPAPRGGARTIVLIMEVVK